MVRHFSVCDVLGELSIVEKKFSCFDVTLTAYICNYSVVDIETFSLKGVSISNSIINGRMVTHHFLAVAVYYQVLTPMPKIDIFSFTETLCRIAIRTQQYILSTKVSTQVQYNQPDGKSSFSGFCSL
jgi:hypothetical protein